MLGDALALGDGVCQPKMDFGVTPSAITSFACSTSLPQPQVCICTPGNAYMQPWSHGISADVVITAECQVGVRLLEGKAKTVGRIAARCKFF